MKCQNAAPKKTFTELLVDIIGKCKQDAYPSVKVDSLKFTWVAQCDYTLFENY